MVHKNYKWNISKGEGKNIAIVCINDILSEQKNNSIELNELIFLLNNRTKNLDITNNKKKKNIVNFLKTNYGGIKTLLEQDIKFVITRKSDKYIISQNKENIFNLNDWVFIDELID